MAGDELDAGLQIESGHGNRGLLGPIIFRSSWSGRVETDHDLRTLGTTPTDRTGRTRWARRIHSAL